MMRSRYAVLGISFFVLMALLCLSGCGAGVDAGASASHEPVALGNIKGNVHGGQQAVAGASVYVYQAGTGGYGGPGIAASTLNASTSLLTSAVLTNNAGNSGMDANNNYFVKTGADGGFSITGDYTCTEGSEVYLYAVGGDPGSGANSAAGFLAILGTCPAGGNLASTAPFVFMNEVSTVAAAYAFAGFASDATHVSSSGTLLAIRGITNAFANAANLVDIATGTAYSTTPGSGAGSTGTVPQSEINTIANILAGCVNTAGPGSTNCGNLFAYTMSDGTSGTPATDTATAAINLAHNSAVTANVSALFGLQSGVASPFSPNLNTAPNDFSLAVLYQGTAIAHPGTMAIDSTGSVWLASGSAALSKIGPTGGVLYSGISGSGLSDPFQLAVDSSDNVWAANSTGTSVSKFSSAGVAMSGSSGYTVSGMQSPSGIALDTSGNAWVADLCSGTTCDSSGAVYKLSSTGSLLGGPYSTGDSATDNGFSIPSWVAIDPSGNIWTADGSVSMAKLSPSGAVLSGTGYNLGLLVMSTLSIDSGGNVWVPDFDGEHIIKTNNSGVTQFSLALNSSTPTPYQIALDGNGVGWNANWGNRACYVSAVTSAGVEAGTNGFIVPSITHCYMSGIAVDGSGNVWATENGASSSQALIQFVGLAAPVVTPITPNYLSTRP